MREGVPELMRVDLRDSGLRTSLLDYLCNTGAGHGASWTEPQCSRLGPRMPSTFTYVPLKGLPCLGTERNEAGAASLAHHNDDILVEIEIIERQSRNLTSAQAGIDEQADECRIPAGREVSTLADLQQLLECVLIDDRNRGLGNWRRLHVRHRRGCALAFLDAPDEEESGGLEPSGDSGWRPTIGQVRQPRFDVFPAKKRDLGRQVRCHEEGAELGERLQVGVSRVGRAVLRPQRPIPGSSERSYVSRYEILGVHDG